MCWGAVARKRTPASEPVMRPGSSIRDDSETSQIRPTVNHGRPTGTWPKDRHKNEARGFGRFSLRATYPQIAGKNGRCLLTSTALSGMHHPTAGRTGLQARRSFIRLAARGGAALPFRPCEIIRFPAAASAFPTSSRLARSAPPYDLIIRQQRWMRRFRKSLGTVCRLISRMVAPRISASASLKRRKLVEK